MTSFSAVPRGRQGASDRREKIAFAFDNYLLSISFVGMFSPNRPPSLPIAALVLVLFGAPLLVRGEWTMELSAVDRAGNIGEARPLGIRQ